MSNDPTGVVLSSVIYRVRLPLKFLCRKRDRDCLKNKCCLWNLESKTIRRFLKTCHPSFSQVGDLSHKPNKHASTCQKQVNYFEKSIKLLIVFEINISKGTAQHTVSQKMGTQLLAYSLHQVLFWLMADFWLFWLLTLVIKCNPTGLSLFILFWVTFSPF
jgi:hypothetical protein